MADSAKLGGVLQDEIEKARDRIKGYNENIKKLTGRDPNVPGIRRFISDDSDRRGNDRGYDRDRGDGYSSMGRGGSFAFGRGGGRGRGGYSFGPPPRRIVTTEDDGPPVQRRTGGAFSRLGPAPGMRRMEREESPYKEELPNKLSVHSSVVSTSRENKNRKDVMEEQTKDSEGMQRNRRMFGLLLGTLNRFKTDSKALKTKEQRRAEIDKKLEDKASKEKKAYQQETKLLVEEMKMEEAKVVRLQQKMDMIQEHDEREEEIKKLKNFIITKSKPKIFWKPREMSSPAESKLKDSEKVVDKMLRDGRERLEKEVKDLMDRESKREERIKQRLREDMDTNGDGKKGSDAQKEGKVSDSSKGENTGEANDEDNADSGKKQRRVVVKGEGQDSDEGMDQTETGTVGKDSIKPKAETNAGSDSDTDVEDAINESAKAPTLKIETEGVEERLTDDIDKSVQKKEISNPDEEDKEMDHEEYDDKLISSKKKEIEKVLNEDANEDKEDERKSRKKRESRHERDDSKDRSKRRKRDKSSERESRRRRRSGSESKNEREERRRRDSDSKHRSRRDSDKDKSSRKNDEDDSPKDKKDTKERLENIEQDGSGDAKIKGGSGLMGEKDDVEMESEERD